MASVTNNSLIYGNIGTTSVSPIKVDAGGNVNTVNKALSKIDNGSAFTYSERFSGMGSGSAKEWHIKTGSTAPDFYMEFIVSGKSDVFLYEAPTIGTSGTLVSSGDSPGIYNRNRSSSIAPLLAIYKNAVTSSNGFQLNARSYTSATGQSYEAQTPQFNRWLLKPNTVYSVRINALSSSFYGNVQIDFSE